MFPVTVVGKKNERFGKVELRIRPYYYQEFNDIS